MRNLKGVYSLFSYLLFSVHIACIKKKEAFINFNLKKKYLLTFQNYAISYRNLLYFPSLVNYQVKYNIFVFLIQQSTITVDLDLLLTNINNYYYYNKKNNQHRLIL